MSFKLTFLKVCQWLATDRWISKGTLVSSTNKTDRHDIAEILLKVSLNTIIQLSQLHFWNYKNHSIVHFDISYAHCNFCRLCLCFSVDSMCNSLFSHNINSYKDKEDKIVNMIRKGWSAGTVGIARPALACGEWNI